MNIWQIGIGTGGIDYSDLFIRYGVALIGPGWSGPWEVGKADDEFEGGFVRWFASNVEIGDAVLMRVGLSAIRAVGIVAGPYEFLYQFDEVMGWDLQHARRVRWCRLPKDYDFGSCVFGAQSNRFSGTHMANVIKFTEQFLQSPPTDWQHAPLPELPLQEPQLENIPIELREIVATVADLNQLYWQDEEFGARPVEDEMVAHYVVPFLRALGWTPEKIAVKWNNIDVALFDPLPRTAESCRLIIEAKRFGAGAEGALDQAKGYAAYLGRPLDVVVTDGIRYRYYDASQDYQSVAYANLSYLKKSAVELFDRMKRK